MCPLLRPAVLLRASSQTVAVISWVHFIRQWGIGCCTWNAFQLWRRLLYLGCILHFCDANADTSRQAVVSFICISSTCDASSISFSCLWRKYAMSGMHFFLFGKKIMTLGRLLDLTCISLFCDANIDRHKGTQLLLGQYSLEFFVKRARIQDQGSKSE